MPLKRRNRLSISTHAPAGGATYERIYFFNIWRISTHAPAGGATFSILAVINSVTVISTHAPAGGATRSAAVWAGIKKYFYSRPCGRGDVDGALDRKNLPDFYSRPCGRGDYQGTGGVTMQDNFYSRPCGRGDSNFPQVRHEVLRQIAER